MFWLPILALGGGLAVVVASDSSPRVGRCCGPAVGRAPIRECMPFAWDPDAVDDALRHVLEEHPEVGGPWIVKTEPTKPRHRRPRQRGVSIGAPSREAQLATLVAEHAYGHTPSGEDLKGVWPAISGDCPQIKAIWGRIMIRVRRHLAALEDGAAEDAWWESGGR